MTSFLLQNLIILFTLSFFLLITSTLTQPPIPNNNSINLDPCIYFYETLQPSNNYSSMTPQEYDFFMYSGHTINDLGEYSECETQANYSTYVLISYSMNGATIGYQGV